MIGRLKLVAMAVAAALAAAPTLTPDAHLGAQEMARFRVLIPDLFPMEGAGDGFGKDVAKELRRAINELPTHQPIQEKEIKDELGRLKMKMNELDCVKTRQLGALINAQVALCASYTESGDDRTFADIMFIDLGASEEFPVDAFTINKNQQREAAERIVSAFDRYVQADRFRNFCFQYAQSSDWEGSLRNCDDALELNPTDEGVLYQRGVTLWKMDRPEEALDQLKALLEVNPYHDEGLQLGGYLATTLGDTDAGRTYYGRYLEINPGAVTIRRNIAFDMYEAGDPEGAMMLIQEGLDVEQSPELLGDFGNYAFETARRAMPEGAQQGGEAGPLPAEVADLFHRAIDAYETVFEAKGDSMGIAPLRNVVTAYVQLGELDQAADFAQRALQIHGDEAALWSVYSTVLERQGRVDEAVQALAEIESIDPDYENLHIRQANLYLRAGRRADALPLFKQAVERGQDPNAVARVIFADAHAKGIAPATKNWQYALDGIEAAKTYDVNADTRSMLDFWHGWVLYSQGIAAQEPRTVASARQAMPLFQRALERFQAGQAYAATESSINLAQIIQATNTYIEIQDAIIKRGG